MSLGLALLQTAMSTSSPSSSGTNNWVVLQVIVPLATPFLGLLGVLFGGKSGRSARSLRQMKQAVEVRGMLPEDSATKPVVVRYIDQLALSYVATRGYRRSYTGIVLAVVLIMLGNYLLYLAVARGGWMALLWVPALFGLILGGVGLGESLARKDRSDDEKRREDRRQRKSGRTTSEPSENTQESPEIQPKQPEATSGGN